MAAKTPRQLQLEALLADDPNDPFLRYGFAMEYVSSGDDESAVGSLRELIAATPYVPAYLQAGQALVRLDRIDEARGVLKAGIAAAAKQGDSHAEGEMRGLLESLD
jgi:predicted Zn-dependent protease